MTQEWDYTTDLLVAGSGAAGLGAAVAGADSGARVIVVESTDKWGGTTFISGGGAWLPNNPVMQREKAVDSFEAALQYMETVVGDVGPASSLARKRAFLNGVADPVLTLEKYGVVWIRTKTYPDYFSHKSGGSYGRALGVKAFDIKKLKDWHDNTRHEEIISFPMNDDDFAELAGGILTIKGAKRVARIAARTARGLFAGRKLRGLGVALSGSLMHIVRGQGTPVWLNSPVKKLLIDDGVVVGAIVDRHGTEVRIQVTKGVFLGTGGFARNVEWRQRYHGIQGWSAATPGDDGSGIQIGIDVGADVSMMHLQWGVPVIPFLGDDSRGTLLIWERSMPHSLLVDQRGQRFVNESIPYVEFIQAVLDHNRKVPSIPSWIITDRRHTRKYLNLASVVGIEKLKEAGTVVEAPTLHGLAKMIDVPSESLLATVERFNEFARKGTDEDFHRGENAYENYYGDSSYRNHNLGELKEGPFRALKMMPGDIGTKGGLLTDELARVLDQRGMPIEGLYAGGNTTASVMGQTYPGPGSTIGPALVFGFIAARHAIRRGTNY